MKKITEDNRLMNMMRSFHVAENEDVRVLFSFYSNDLFAFSKDWQLLDVIKSSFDESGRELYVAYCVIGHEIIMAPFYASNFISINYLTGEQKVLEGLIDENEKYLEHKYRSCFVQDEYAWFIGEKIKKIICLKVGETCEVVKKYNFGDFCWSYDHTILNKKIYIPSMDSNRMLIINTDEKNVEIKELSHGNADGYSGIYLKDEKIVLVDRYGNRYLYEQDDIQATGIKDDYVIFKSFNYKNNVIKLCRRQMGVYVERINGEEEYLKIDMNNVSDVCEIPFMAGLVDGDNFICQGVDGNLYRYDDDLKDFRKISIIGMGDSVMETIHKDICASMFSKKIVSESPLYELKDWIQSII